MAATNDIGVLGLGVMGGNLARNFASRGFRVAGYDRTLPHGRALAAEHPDAKLDIAETPEAFVASLKKPRRIIVLVNAGKPVDSVLETLAPLLEADDVVVDAGNSLYTDTNTRLQRYANAKWHFVGMGVSGGSEGALKGPSLMPGGHPKAYENLAPLLIEIAATSEQGACVTYCGKGAAGHFVKMVHNGIEYGDMQLITEAATLLRDAMGMTGTQAADVFAHWNQGELESYLIGITSDILRVRDPDAPKQLLVDSVLDKAGQKGTGRWTVVAAAELGVPIPTIAAAVDARALSAQKDLRVLTAQTLGATRKPLELTPLQIGDALYVAKIASYAQGFTMLSEADRAHGFETNLAEIARIWTAGCIIRAALLPRLRTAFSRGATGERLILADGIVDAVKHKMTSLRTVVAAATNAGWPVPALSASLGWLEQLAQARGGGALIQAQRDYFGSHTYERVDRPGVFVHSDWEALARR